MADTLAWYSMDQDMNTVDHPPVSLPEALEIAKKCFDNRDRKYAQAEQALAETFFGLTRDEDTFIEICANAGEDSTYKFEMPASAAGQPWYRKIFMSVFQHESTLKSWEEAEAKIREFYAEEPQEIRRRLSGTK
ncbi:MAG: hypothetical protein EPN97_10555 [Alphaproteobacteria bacterium]|nr:MAG: hypothetical protein EPN97_10555 [Alphaproteobacteria bacterium]